MASHRASCQLAEVARQVLANAMSPVVLEFGDRLDRGVSKRGACRKCEQQARGLERRQVANAPGKLGKSEVQGAVQLADAVAHVLHHAVAQTHELAQLE